MQGINSSGRRVSLLNDEQHQVDARLAAYSSFSTTPSPVSSPGRSLHPPPLSRSGSSDSQETASPSPSTPDMTFERMPQHDRSLSDGFRPQIVSNSSFHYATPQPYPALQQHQHQHQHQQLQQQEQQPGLSKVQSYLQNGVPRLDHQFSSAPKTSIKKNQYPCPVAKLYNCQDFFTTSGHAARHAKKHTGKKDAVCPECNKAFTRKDNMEQHRRTHSGGRGLANSQSTKSPLDASRERKVKQLQQRRRSRSSNMSTDFAVDPQLQSHSPYSTAVEYEYAQTPNVPARHVRPELRRSSLEESMSYGRMHPAALSPRYVSVDTSRSGSGSRDNILSPSLAPALDALALAASRQ